MRVEEHMNAYQEHRDAIDWAINRGLDRSQRIIGSHASRAIVELLSVYLHQISKIEPGFQINHRWFKSGKVSDRLPDFPGKAVVISKMVELEIKSENTTYGSQRSEKEVKDAVVLVNELEDIIRSLMNHEK